MCKARCDGATGTQRGIRCRGCPSGAHGLEERQSAVTRSKETKCSLVEEEAQYCGKVERGVATSKEVAQESYAERWA